MSARIPIWSRVAFLVLLPFVLYSIWDYIESRRLQSRLNALQASGQLAGAQPARPPAETLQAERLYRAAAALVTIPAGDNRDALEFVDRAASLPFRSFISGASYNYMTGDLWKLTDFLEHRAAIEIHEGKPDAALTTFFSEARLMRAIEAIPSGVGTSFVPRFRGLSEAMSAGTRASVRQALADAFAELDRDDRMKAVLINDRTRMLSSAVPPFLGPSRRTANPFVAHILVGQLDAFAASIAAAGAPWPARIDAVNAVGVWPYGFATRGPHADTALRNFTKLVAGQVQRIRCARIIVSQQPLDLIDPFTGKRLEPSQCHL